MAPTVVGQELPFGFQRHDQPLQRTKVDFPELAFKRIDKTWIKSEDYIQWVNNLLEAGSDALSICELAVFRWDAYVDPDQVERVFQSCVDELGLELPCDWHVALCSYSTSICESMLRGEIQPSDCLTEMLTLTEDHNDPYIHWMWIDLTRDLEPKPRRTLEDTELNGVLDLQNPDECFRRVAHQFVALCAMPLPNKFPLTWICHDCQASCDESTFTVMMSRKCTKCGAFSGMKNMRVFENRDALLKSRSGTAFGQSPE